MRLGNIDFVFHSWLVLHVGGVHIVGQGDKVVVGDPEPGWQEEKVDKLSRRPQQPLGNVQFTT